MKTATLPSREQGFVRYPQRDLDAAPSWLDETLTAWHAATRGARPAQLPTPVAEGLASARDGVAKLDDEALAQALPGLRARIRAGKLKGISAGWALGLAEAACRRRLGLVPYDTQRLAAWLMLDGQFAEVATGEGKTLAAALAATAAALAGIPVHLMTANDYLVQRDRERLAPLAEGLGLSCACVLPSMSRAQRVAAYRSDIVVVTAREASFDYLRDHLLLRGVRDPRLLEALAITTGEAEVSAGTGFGDLGTIFGDTRGMDVGLGVGSSVGLDVAPPEDTHVPAGTVARRGAAAGPSPVLPGLCMAILDEADSILLDEATTPLILAAPLDAVEVRSYERAMTIAGSLRRGRHYKLDAARRCELEDEGRDAVTAQVQALGNDTGLLRPMRRAHELVEAALTACHGLQRDRDYLVDSGKLHLVDEVTGRIAEGRQWTGPLQAMVEMKEGLRPSPATRVSAQITYPRFFPRYLRLSGMSGTLVEDARELTSSYGAHVRRVPLVKPDLRRDLGEQVYLDSPRRDAAVVQRVLALVREGRPVLVGTDSVAASRRLAASLRAAGVEPQVLDAMQDADEAGLIARAGRAGVVTVATNMAGRGTDISLDERARAAGGLHVIATMRNRSRRIDRQLFGRAARHGDPGSVESMLSLDDTFFVEHGTPTLLRALAARARDGVVPATLAAPFVTAAQRRAESRDRAQRAQLRRAEQRVDELFAFAGGVE